MSTATATLEKVCVNVPVPESELFLKESMAFCQIKVLYHPIGKDERLRLLSDPSYEIYVLASDNDHRNTWILDKEMLTISKILGYAGSQKYGKVVSEWIKDNNIIFDSFTKLYTFAYLDHLYPVQQAQRGYYRIVPDVCTKHGVVEYEIYGIGEDNHPIDKYSTLEDLKKSKYWTIDRNTQCI